jgi:hypothetical protein
MASSTAVAFSEVYVKSSFERDRLKKTLKIRAFYIISLTSLGVLAALIGVLVFQQFYNKYYKTSISISIITVSYGTAAVFIIQASYR